MKDNTNVSDMEKQTYTTTYTAPPTEWETRQELTYCEFEERLVNQDIRMCSKEMPNEADIKRCGPDCPCYSPKTIVSYCRSASSTTENMLGKTGNEEIESVCGHPFDVSNFKITNIHKDEDTDTVVVDCIIPNSIYSVTMTLTINKKGSCKQEMQ